MNEVGFNFNFLFGGGWGLSLPQGVYLESHIWCFYIPKHNLNVCACWFFFFFFLFFVFVCDFISLNSFGCVI